MCSGLISFITICSMLPQSCTGRYQTYMYMVWHHYEILGDTLDDVEITEGNVGAKGSTHNHADQDHDLLPGKERGVNNPRRWRERNTNVQTENSGLEKVWNYCVTYVIP